MANDDLQNERAGESGNKASDPESPRGWKSQWVESKAPRAKDPIGEIRVGRRENPPELDEIPGDGGRETTEP